MKGKNTRNLGIALIAVAAWITGCENAEYSTIENAIYLDEASSAVAGKVMVDPQDITTASLTPRLAQAVDEEVTAVLEIDKDYLEAYNRANMTSYEVIPSENCSFEKEIVIKAGKVSASPVLFTIRPYSNANGELYAIPVSMRITKGNIAAIGSSNKFILLLNKPLIQSVPVMTTSNFAQTDPATPWSESVSEWTIETWVQMDGFKINNQAIINSGGNGTEVYIRFGDASIPYNSLQIKTQGVQVNTVTLFEAHKWYHVAVTYDASGVVTIYVNGVKDVTIQTKGGSANFTQMGIVTSGSWFRNKCQMAQLRLWRVALGQTQIQSNMYFGLRADDTNMMGYWRLDEGTGNLFKDSTPNARHMTAGGTLEWRPDVRFDK